MAFKTYQVVCKPEDEQSRQWGGDIHQRLQEQGYRLSKKPDIVFAVGGDGTMLKAFEQNYGPRTGFIALHSGTLGFYSDWVAEEKEELLQAVFHQEPQKVYFSLLSIHLHYKDKIKTYLALNDFQIQGIFKTFICDVEINGELFEHFRGGGINVATPLGSTAYNLSAGGAVIHPSLRCIQIMGITPINNIKFRTLERGLILPNHHSATFYPRNEAKDYMVGYDSTQLQTKGLQKIVVRVAEEEICFLRYRAHPFWNRVHDNFLGN